MKKNITIYMFIIAIMCTLTGCNNNTDELIEYKNKMTLFTTAINNINTNINELDVNSPDSTELVLEFLDELDTLFRDLAALSVPDEFSSIEKLADDAANYMTLAVSNYHIVFTTVPFDEYAAILAEENYKQAMRHQYYIGEILQGKVPEGDDVIILTDDNL